MKNRNLILGSLLAMLVSGTMIAGTTYALFTDKAKTDIAINSATVDVDAIIENVYTYSMDVAQPSGTFENGGLATLNDSSELVLSNITPGDRVELNIKVTNNSNINIKYQTVISKIEDTGLFSGLKVTIDSQTFAGEKDIKSEWTLIDPSVVDVAYVPVVIELPVDAGNEYQGKATKINFAINAVQGNTVILPSHEIDEETKTVFVNDAEGLNWLSSQVSDENNTFAGYVIKLGADIDLKNEEFTPIGNLSHKFSASFDGQGHTISNLKITALDTANKASENRKALFGGYQPVGATYIKNVTIENVDISGGCYVSCLVAVIDSGNVSASGNHVAVSNITIKGDITLDCYYGGGAVVSSGNCSELTNIVVDVNQGSYISNSKNGPENSWACLGSVQGFGYVSKIDNIKSNLDVVGKLASVGGLFGIIGGSSDNKITSYISNVSYTGNVVVTDTEAERAISASNHNKYQYNGLIIGAPRFTVVVDQNTCSSTGTLTLNLTDEVKYSNDMSNDFVWGVDLFGASRDANYKNKSYCVAYEG